MRISIYLFTFLLSFGVSVMAHSKSFVCVDEKLHKEYYSIYKKLEADPDLRFPNLMKEHPLPPHPTQGYDADRPDWKPEQ